MIITGVRLEDERALVCESRYFNPVIHLIFARCSVILVCWQIVFKIHRAMLKHNNNKNVFEFSLYVSSTGQMKFIIFFSNYFDLKSIVNT